MALTPTPLSSAEVKERVELLLFPLWGLRGMFYGELYYKEIVRQGVDRVKCQLFFFCTVRKSRVP